MCPASSIFFSSCYRLSLCTSTSRADQDHCCTPSQRWQSIPAGSELVLHFHSTTARLISHAPYACHAQQRLAAAWRQCCPPQLLLLLQQRPAASSQQLSTLQQSHYHHLHHRTRCQTPPRCYLDLPAACADSQSPASCLQVLRWASSACAPAPLLLLL
jgi:hypothetical protein